jgi:hypothetical protein
MKTAFIRQTLFTTAFLATFSAGLAQNKPASKSNATIREGITSSHSESDGTRINESRIRFDKEDKSYSLKLVDDKVTELIVDGKTVPADSMHLYKELIDSIIAQMEKDRAQAAEDRKQAALDREQAQRDRAQAIRDRAQAEKDRAQAQQDRARAEGDRERMNSDRQQAQKDREQASRDREQAIRDRAQAEKDREQAQRDRAQAVIDRKQAEEDRALIKSLLETAVKDGLVTSTNAVSQLELSGDGFWINDKKQSAEMHAKYKAAFLKKEGSRLSFSRSHSGTRISI